MRRPEPATWEVPKGRIKAQLRMQCCYFSDATHRIATPINAARLRPVSLTPASDIARLRVPVLCIYPHLKFKARVCRPAPFAPYGPHAGLLTWAFPPDFPCRCRPAPPTPYGPHSACCPPRAPRLALQYASRPSEVNELWSNLTPALRS